MSKEFSIKKDMRSFTNFHSTKSDTFVSRFREGDNEYRMVLFPNIGKTFEVESYGGNVYDNFVENGPPVGQAKMAQQENGLFITNVQLGEDKYQITSYPEVKDGKVEYWSGPVSKVEDN